MPSCDSVLLDCMIFILIYVTKKRLLLVHNYSVSPAGLTLPSQYVLIDIDLPEYVQSSNYALNVNKEVYNVRYAIA